MRCISGCRAACGEDLEGGCTFEVSAMTGPVYHGLDLTLLARTMMLLITCGSKGEYEASALREGGKCHQEHCFFLEQVSGVEEIHTFNAYERTKVRPLLLMAVCSGQRTKRLASLEEVLDVFLRGGEIRRHQRDEQ